MTLSSETAGAIIGSRSTAKDPGDGVFIKMLRDKIVGGQPARAGQVIECTSRDAKLAINKGWAEAAEKPQAKPKRKSKKSPVNKMDDIDRTRAVGETATILTSQD